MFSELKNEIKVVGSKETLQAIYSGKAEQVFVAEDADKEIRHKISNAANKTNIKIKIVESKMKLGRACGIEVAAASAAVLK